MKEMNESFTEHLKKPKILRLGLGGSGINMQINYANVLADLVSEWEEVFTPYAYAIKNSVKFLLVDTNRAALESALHRLPNMFKEAVETSVITTGENERAEGAAFEPEKARAAFAHHADEFKEMINGYDCPVAAITAGLGKGTGMGLVYPVIQIVRSLNMLDITLLAEPAYQIDIFSRSAMERVAKYKGELDNEGIPYMLIKNEYAWSFDDDLSLFQAYERLEREVSRATLPVMNVLALPHAFDRSDLQKGFHANPQDWPDGVENKTKRWIMGTLDLSAQDKNSEEDIRSKLLKKIKESFCAFELWRTGEVLLIVEGRMPVNKLKNVTVAFSNIIEEERTERNNQYNEDYDIHLTFYPSPRREKVTLCFWASEFSGEVDAQEMQEIDWRQSPQELAAYAELFKELEVLSEKEKMQTHQEGTASSFMNSNEFSDTAGQKQENQNSTEEYLREQPNALPEASMSPNEPLDINAFTTLGELVREFNKGDTEAVRTVLASMEHFGEQIDLEKTWKDLYLKFSFPRVRGFIDALSDAKKEQIKELFLELARSAEYEDLTPVEQNSIEQFFRKFNIDQASERKKLRNKQRKGGGFFSSVRTAESGG